MLVPLVTTGNWLNYCAHALDRELRQAFVTLDRISEQFIREGEVHAVVGLSVAADGEVPLREVLFKLAVGFANRRRFLRQRYASLQFNAVLACL